MDGGLLNSMVGEYLHDLGSNVAKEFHELTKAAALPPDSPGLVEMIQQLYAMGEMFKQFIELEIPKEDDNSSPGKKAKKEESSRVAVDDDEEKVQFWIDTAGDKAPALAAKKDEDDDMKQLHAIAEMFKIKQFNAKRKLEIPKEDDNSSPAKKAKKEESSRVVGDGDEEKVQDSALAAKKDEDDDKKQAVEDSRVVRVYGKRITSVDVLKEACGKYGTITDASLKLRNKSSGFITFSSSKEAEAAVAAMNGMNNVDGRRIYCRIYKPTGARGKKKKRKDVLEGRRIKYHNVSEESYDDIKEEFGKFGDVNDFHMKVYWKSAFITFSTSEEARACVAALNNTLVAGIKIKIDIVRPRLAKVLRPRWTRS